MPITIPSRQFPDRDGHGTPEVSPRTAVLTPARPEQPSGPLRGGDFAMADPQCDEDEDTTESPMESPDSSRVATYPKSEVTARAFDTGIPRSSPFVNIDPAPLSLPQAEPADGLSSGFTEDVVFMILESVESIEDLVAVAIINKAFYAVFKRHEVWLVKHTVRKHSIPAWEYREATGTNPSDPLRNSLQCSGHGTSLTYTQQHLRDTHSLSVAKSLILYRCHSFLRTETIQNLGGLRTDVTSANKVDDAIWRVWTFCKIFGSSKGLNEDISGQIDWLKGGKLAHQSSCTSSIIFEDFTPLDGALLNASPSFGKGNAAGLTSVELYDMLEIWNCLTCIILDFQGEEQLREARTHGVFDGTGTTGGDQLGEQALFGQLPTMDGKGDGSRVR